jgi:hypothetical protein
MLHHEVEILRSLRETRAVKRGDRLRLNAKANPPSAGLGYAGRRILALPQLVQRQPPTRMLKSGQMKIQAPHVNTVIRK